MGDGQVQVVDMATIFREDVKIGKGTARTVKRFPGTFILVEDHD